MSKRRERLAAHRQRLVAQSAQLRGELVADLAGLREKASVVAKIASLVPLVRPVASIAWRHFRRRRARRQT
jgi:hypothetical protein